MWEAYSHIGDRNRNYWISKDILGINTNITSYDVLSYLGNIGNYNSYIEHKCSQTEDKYCNFGEKNHRHWG